MEKEKLDELWRVLSSATNIYLLEYGRAVTIGSVFGQMRKTIEEQQKEIEQLENHVELIERKGY